MPVRVEPMTRLHYFAGVRPGQLMCCRGSSHLLSRHAIELHFQELEYEFKVTEGKRKDYIKIKY